MKTLFALLSLLLLSFTLRAEELVRTLSFPEVAASGALRAGEVTDGRALTVTAVAGKPFQPLIELVDPGISSAVYALRGMIRYENVEGDGYLQLDNYFAGQGAFFTKTLAVEGPLRKLSGSSEWRAFVLPFFANSGEQADGTSPVPEKLVLSLFLPAEGSVSIRDVALYQYVAGENPLRLPGQWLSGRAGTWVGAIGGTLLGLWGALVGVISNRGKARGFVLGSTMVLLMLGIVSLGAGAVALASAQPRAVYYPFLSLGILLIVLMAVFRKTLSRRYEQMELKRMQSMDA
jgi:hypothetical protein